MTLVLTSAEHRTLFRSLVVVVEVLTSPEAVPRFSFPSARVSVFGDGFCYARSEPAQLQSSAVLKQACCCFLDTIQDPDSALQGHCTGAKTSVNAS